MIEMARPKSKTKPNPNGRVPVQPRRFTVNPDVPYALRGLDALPAFNLSLEQIFAAAHALVEPKAQVVKPAEVPVEQSRPAEPESPRSVAPSDDFLSSLTLAPGYVPASKEPGPFAPEPAQPKPVSPNDLSVVSAEVAPSFEGPLVEPAFSSSDPVPVQDLEKPGGKRARGRGSGDRLRNRSARLDDDSDLLLPSSKITSGSFALIAQSVNPDDALSMFGLNLEVLKQELANAVTMKKDDTFSDPKETAAYLTAAKKITDAQLSFIAQALYVFVNSRYNTRGQMNEMLASIGTKGSSVSVPSAAAAIVIGTMIGEQECRFLSKITGQSYSPEWMHTQQVTMEIAGQKYTVEKTKLAISASDALARMMESKKSIAKFLVLNDVYTAVLEALLE